MPIATCVLSAWLLWETAGPADWRGIGVSVLIGALLFALRAWRRGR